MRFAKMLLATLLILAVAAGAAFAEGAQEGAAEDRGEVEIAYVEWARAVAITHVAAVVLEDLGWEASVNNVSNAAMWQSVAAGDSDALLCAWLPVTHQNEYGQFQDDVVDLGPNYTGAQLGLVVPEYVDVDSIPELVESAEQFDSEIVGIDPGAGMMQATENAIESDTSGLGTFELLEGSGPTMAAALGSAIDNQEPIVVTGWAPHWKFGRWDLKILDDPAGIYGEAETINTIVRTGLQEDDPELYTFFNEFDWQSVDLGPVLVMNQEGMDPMESARQFVADNEDLIQSAIPDSLK